MNKQPDFNIDEYEIGELLDIFNITQPVQKEAIMKIVGEFIGKYRQLEQSEYVEFFSKAMNKLVSNYQQVEGILGKVDAILDDAIESKQNIKQTVEDLQERAEDMYEDAQDIYEDVKETVQGMYEDTQEKAGDLMEKAEETFEQVQEKAEDIYEQGVDAYQDAKKITNEFLNPKVEDAGPNVLRNRYYNAQTGPERVGSYVMPNRGDYISVPNDEGVNQHATQLRQRLMVPNAFAQIPYAQGYRNPTLQNAYISWVNVDSQYREIKPTGTASASCSKFPDASGIDTTVTSPTNSIFQNDSSTDFLFTLQSPITNVLAMTVGSMEVPLSGYYAFSDRYGNTTFEILLNDKPVACLRIPEGNYDASAIMLVINAELSAAWHIISASSSGSILFSPYPQLFINASNQKAYFAFWPHSPASSLPVKIRWFEKSRCGCCIDCCNRANAILRAKKTESWNTSTPFYKGEKDAKEYLCSDNNTGKKINSTLGWSLGFRQGVSPLEYVNTIVNPVADASLNEIGNKSNNAYYGTFGSCVWNALGTKYFILEVDDFNRNRNTGNMGTMTMPSCTEKFKIPSYAKQLSQVYPVCNEKSQTPDSSSNEEWPQQLPEDLPLLKRSNPLTGEPSKTEPLKFGKNEKPRKGYYENFKRSCRKGTPAEEFGVKGQDTLTKAQKYTARELSNARANSCTNQYHAPQASNILFRFPVERLSSNLQVPLIVPNSSGMANGRRYFGPVNIEKLRIRLLDDKGNPADFHCADISFSLIMERLYQY
jgi:hypothetical protein